MIFKKITDKVKTLNLVQNYRKIFPYVRPYWVRALVAVLITIPIGSMDAVIAWVLKPYMDTVMIEKSRVEPSLPACAVMVSQAMCPVDDELCRL